MIIPNPRAEFWSDDVNERPSTEAMKKEINNFLWTHLPPSMPMRDAEMIAIEVFQQMNAAWDEHDRRTPRAEPAAN